MNELRENSQDKILMSPAETDKEISTSNYFKIFIARTPAEVFTFWRNLKNLPLFMKDLKEIEIISKNRSKWTVELEIGLKATWEAEIIAEIPNEMIAWNSLEGSDIETSGSIWFLTGRDGMGTVVNLILNYKLPGGKISETITRMMGEDPASLAKINLRRLKIFLETGVIPIDSETRARSVNWTPAEAYRP